MKLASFLLPAMALFFSGCMLFTQKTRLDASTGATRLGATVQMISKDKALEIVSAFVKESGPYYFATCDNGQARVRPIGIYMVHEGRLWFHVGKHKDSYRQLVENPRIEISATAKNGDWIRITGTAVPEYNKAVDDGTFDKAPSLRKMYNKETGRALGHFYIKDGKAEISRRDGTVELYFF